MDFETIRKKIDSGRYKTVAEWRADVELIWSNSLKYHQYDVMCLITKDLQEYFRDISNELSDFPEIDWSTRLKRLESELHGLMQNMPNSMKPRVRHTKKQPPLPDSARSKKKFTVFTSDEVQRLTRDIFNIKDNEQLLQLVNILVKNESSIDMNGESLDVQMNSLRPQTLHELRSAVDGFIATV